MLKTRDDVLLFHKATVAASPNVEAAREAGLKALSEMRPVQHGWFGHAVEATELDDERARQLASLALSTIGEADEADASEASEFVM